jgi:hypothetical protein
MNRILLTARSRLAFTTLLFATVTLLNTVLSAYTQEQRVDLLLVLASDVSRSVDQPKFQLQREGYASAIQNSRVLNAIKSGTLGRIAICFIEWSGPGAQKVVIDWTVVDGAGTAQKFADQLIELPRSFADRTAIGSGIEFAVQQIDRSPFLSTRRTIDVSGDGTNNAGRDIRTARDEALAKGIVINGLVILSDRPLAWNPEHTNPPGGLENYYRKLIAEIASLDMPASGISAN